MNTMNREKILVVDDDLDIQELIRFNLKREGYTVYVVGSGEEALSAAADIKPEVIILDRMLPGIDGVEVCRRLKGNQNTQSIPVVMLTAKTEDDDVVAGLESGADDYVTKPFSPKVLLARIRATLRRAHEKKSGVKSDILRIHNLIIDVAQHEVSLNSRIVNLSATEFAILEFLARNPGWVFSRTKIIDGVKGKDYPVTERSVDVQILGIRKKLGEAGSLIQTVRGVGYRMIAE